ncbi:phage BR0599 family protein [Entomomonas sp. E2T0]|uniref:phage BR0599 family protein n=1 Tax=Entomomonas sp. E2T0 TaxID=2930213 RepID=UPI0022281D91|nr:phage BR0599 family protein [Entomomonas sp. E2T0]UYZ84278.1 phage BR0599 family protein [Entomomonas sp. E2T0]
MSYETIENSLADREPIRCYKFSRGALTWLYNTSSEAITRNNMRFLALTGGISDSGIIRSNGSQTDNFTVIAPATIAIAKLYNEQAPSNRIYLTVYNAHRNTEKLIQCWYGAINGINNSEIDQVKIICTPNASLANKPGATQVYARQCDAVIYDTKCKVNKELYRVNGTVQQISTSSIQVIQAANYPDGWFNGGFIQFDVGSGELDRRYIENHQGATLIVWGGGVNLNLGQAINLFPGCNQATSTCQNKFDNLLNMQACPHIQGRSIFDGNPVW